MITLFVIDSPAVSLGYPVFYLAAILVAGIMFVLDGRRRGYPIASWMLIYLTGTLGFIVCSKLAAYGPDDWQMILLQGQFSAQVGKTVIGGIFGGFMGIALARRILHFSYPVLDSMAIALPLAMGIQRFGCLLAGCCHGTPTDAPWAIQYSRGSIPYFHHLEEGLIDANAVLSAGIHPNQAYHAFFCLAIAFTAWRFRNLFHCAGSLWCFSLGLYFIARFVVEFSRESDSSWMGLPGFWSLKAVQWITIVLSLVAFTILFLRERRTPAEAKEQTAESTLRLTFLFFMASLTILALSRWFSPAEYYAMRILLIPSILFYTAAVYRRAQTHHPVMAALASGLILVIVVSGSLNGQTGQRDDTNGHSAKAVTNETGLRYGAMAFEHYHAAPMDTTIYYPGGTDYCGQYYPAKSVTTYEPVGNPYIQRLRSLTAFFTQRTQYNTYNAVEWSAELTGGLNTHKDDNRIPDVAVYNTAVRAKADTRWIGAGLGLHINNTLVEHEDGDIVYTEDHETVTYGNMSFSIRVLPYDIFYLKYRFNELLPYSNALRRSNQFVFGTGFGRTDGTCLEIGADSKGGLFIGGKAYIAGRLGLTAALIGQRHDQTRAYIPEIGLSYLFPAGKGH